MSVPPGRVPRSTWILLGLLTLFSFGGPLPIFLVLRGGKQSGWPPDRPVEWATFVGICGAVVAMMSTCLVVGMRQYIQDRRRP